MTKELAGDARAVRSCTRIALGFCLVGVLCLPAGASGDAKEGLRFARDGIAKQTIDTEGLVSRCSPVQIQVQDPYYQRLKTFRACPFARVLELGFAKVPLDPQANVFLRALDGYTQTASVEKLRDSGAHLAFEDLSNPAGSGWEPIDRRQVDPAPFYLVWTGAGQQDLHQFPWPYQLSEIDIAPFEREYPHTLPAGLPPRDPAWSGFAIFRTQCVICHAINGEGGRIGPELNVPRSIVEYRPGEQIRAYIRDPAAFRHTSMPSHRHLGDGELDALIAYFRAMSSRKHDPGNPHGH
jgi:mono/diheme cytochrome c family protein